jgi:lipid-A-disaccharide synthase
MLIAGEASGDTLAAELVGALRERLVQARAQSGADVQPLRTALTPHFFGAGGPKMATAGVELAFDMTPHAVTGLSEALKGYFKFRRLMRELLQLAIRRRPDIIICVDFSGFNRRFAHAVRERVRAERGLFNNWNPKIVQYVSPQVWASREGRAQQMAQDYDLVLSIFPFEKAWYAARVPRLHVAFVGHPMVGRFSNVNQASTNATRDAAATPRIVLLPGSRADEVRRHLPLVAETARRMLQVRPAEFVAIAPNETMAAEVRAALAALAALGPVGRVQVGGIAEALRTADLAISKTGTVLMECAMFRVPAVTFYKTSWPTYFIGKRLVKVKWLTMPNILADEAIFPEFVQHEATPDNLARAALDLLADPARRAAIQDRLREIVASLGRPGAAQRAARIITNAWLKT